MSAFLIVLVCVYECGALWQWQQCGAHCSQHLVEFPIFELYIAALTVRLCMRPDQLSFFAEITATAGGGGVAG